MAANNPDYNTQELRYAICFEESAGWLIESRDRIAKGDFPTWTVAIQKMTPEQGQNYKYDVVSPFLRFKN